MKNYFAFLKKEFLESARTYKLLIVIIVFFIFGMMNPLTAKFMPDLVNSIMPEGMEVTLANPTAFDSWTQFYKNITQMGTIVIVILFSGIMATELSKGTLINMLTKGLSRRAVILSKYTFMVLLWTIGLFICFAVTWGYTVYLFPNETVAHLLFSVFCLWLFVVFLLSVLIFAATIIKSSYGTLLTVGVVVVLLFVVNLMPALQQYNPLLLVSGNMDLLMNTTQVPAYTSSIIFTVLCSAGLVAGAVLVFRKRQI